MKNKAPMFVTVLFAAAVFVCLPRVPATAADCSETFAAAEEAFEQDSYEEALTGYDDARNCWLKQSGGVETDDTSLCLTNAGFSLILLEKNKEALEYLTRALQADISLKGEKHPNVAVDYRNLGNALLANKHYNKAQHAFEKALAIDTQVVEPSNISISRDYAGLAAVIRQKPPVVFPMPNKEYAPTTMASSSNIQLIKAMLSAVGILDDTEINGSNYKDVFFEGADELVSLIYSYIDSGKSEETGIEELDESLKHFAFLVDDYDKTTKYVSSFIMKIKEPCYTCTSSYLRFSPSGGSLIEDCTYKTNYGRYCEIRYSSSPVVEPISKNDWKSLFEMQTKKSLNLNFKTMSYHVAIGRYYSKTGLYQEAETQFAIALDMINKTGGKGFEKAEINLFLADLFFIEGKPEEARQSINASMKYTCSRQGGVSTSTCKRMPFTVNVLRKYAEILSADGQPDNDGEAAKAAAAADEIQAALDGGEHAEDFP